MRRSRNTSLDKNIPRGYETGRVECQLRRKEETMSLMCTLQICAATPGMCGHEKAMPGIAVLLAAGVGASLLLV